jgi:DNA mismatch repair ATPase MutS
MYMFLTLVFYAASPSVSIPQIEARQSLVTLFRTQQYFAEDLRSILKRHSDPARIVQRINLDKRDPNYLLDLKDFIRGNNARVKQLLSEHIARVEEQQAKKGNGQQEGGEEGLEALKGLVGELADHSELAMEIESAIDETGVRKKVREKEKALQDALDAYQGVEKDDESGSSSRKAKKEEEEDVEEEQEEEDGEEEDSEEVKKSRSGPPREHVGAVAESRTTAWQDLFTDSWSFRPS